MQLPHASATSSATWRFGSRGALTLDEPRIMAVINATPDSFFTGSRVSGGDEAVASIESAVRDGADVIDLGAESTRPGAERVAAADQLARLLPIIERVRAHADSAVAAIPISVDTTLTEVAAAALDAGADAVNDVSGGDESPEILRLAAEHAAGLILMHRRRPPDRESFSDAYAADQPAYADVVGDVTASLAAKLDAARSAGVPDEAVVLDVGLGFGKTVEQTGELIRATADMLADPRLGGRPLLSATSRKSFVGRLSLERDSSPDERLPGSLAFSVMHLLGGARLFRVHDVLEQRQALRAAWSLMRDLADENRSHRGGA
ncbi:MAG: dihydropteroate synthase [Planctomycetota bacterium]